MKKRIPAIILSLILSVWAIPAYALEPALEDGTTGAATPDATLQPGEQESDGVTQGGNPDDPVDHDGDTSDTTGEATPNEDVGGDQGQDVTTITPVEPIAPTAPEIAGQEANQVETLAQSPAASSYERGLYTIASICAPGKVVDISGARTDNGAPAQIYTANGTYAQMFDIQPQGDGTYLIAALNSGKFLTAVISPNANGATAGNATNVAVQPAPVVQRSRGGDEQLWTIQLANDGAVRLVNKANGQALQVRDGIIGDAISLQTVPLTAGAAANPADVLANSTLWNLRMVESPVAPNIYKIRANYGSRKALDVPGGSTASGAELQIWSNNNNMAQRFYLAKAVQPGVYTIEALCSAKRLAQWGNAVVQSDVSGNVEQQWRVVSSPSGGLAFMNLSSGKMLDVSGRSDADSAKVDVFEANGTPAQSFTLERTRPLNDGYYFISSSVDGRVLDVVNHSTSNGANVQVYTKHGDSNQKWRLTWMNDNWYSITNANSSKALDVAGIQDHPGTNVQQWDNYRGKGQLWYIDYTGNGTYRLVTQCGWMQLDVAGGGGADGANLQVYSANNNANQKFRFEPTTYVPPIPASWQAMTNRIWNVSSRTGWLLAIDSSNCIVGVYQGSAGNWERMATWACAPGAWGTPTVKGLYTIGSRGYSFGTSSYTCYYWTQFYGNYLFHSVLYYPGTRTIQDGTLGVPRSHGCVRLAIENAQWINNYIPTGTTVVSY